MKALHKLALERGMALAVKGTGFSPSGTTIKSMRALAPEGMGFYKIDLCRDTLADSGIDIFDSRRTLAYMNNGQLPTVLRFKPHVGNDYCKANLLQKRLLIVGESHYHECTCSTCEKCKHLQDGTFTAYIVKKYAEKHQFFLKTRMLFENIHAPKKHEFWKDVAFYNYLQKPLTKAREPVDEKNRMSPPNQMAFIKTLQRLMPDRVLVLGKTNLRYLPSQDSNGLSTIVRTRAEKHLPLASAMGGLNEIDKVCYWYSVKESPWMLLGGIKHPSSYGFRVSDWQEWIGKFMANRKPPRT